MNYGDVIEYIDGTFSGEFEAAKVWAKEHGVSFDEDLTKRNLPKRYFVIGSEIETEEKNIQHRVRFVRNYYLDTTDKYVSVPDFPLSDEERELYINYRQYLRDYTKAENWWLEEPKTFEEWSAVAPEEPVKDSNNEAVELYSMEI